MSTGRRGATALLAAVCASAAVSGCGFFGDDDAEGESVSVFDVAPGDCLVAPEEVEAQLDSLQRVPCDEPHGLEFYASVPFRAAEGEDGSTYPGNEELTTFAQSACAQEFAPYVGLDYRDSSLYFTYLLPSARSWEQSEDRNILCFVTTAGEQLTASAEGSKK